MGGVHRLSLSISSSRRHLTRHRPPKKISEWLVPRCDLEQSPVLDSLNLQCGIIYCNGTCLYAEGVGHVP